MSTHSQYRTTPAEPAIEPTVRRRFRADIQGLRGLAVSAVIVYHLSSGLAPGGYAGVDIFFVVSGFVISALIRDSLIAQAFSIKSFYRRRILRLYPALFTTITISIIVGAWILPPDDLRELGRTTVSTVLYSSNFDFFLLIGYFNSEAGLKPLLHMWSLAVEEQFYLVFPIMLVLGWKWLPGRIPILIGCLLVTSFGLELWTTRRSPELSFYSPVSRAFEFAIGAMLPWAQLRRITSRPGLEAISFLGVGMIAGAVWLFDDATRFPGIAALVPCIGTALLIHVGPSVALVGRVLSSGVLVFLGDASYSLYLWHWPVLVFARHASVGRMTHGTTIVVLIVSLLLGILSRRFIEKPIMTAQRPAWPVFRCAVGAMATLIALGLVLYLGGGWPSRFSQRVREIYNSKHDVNKVRASCHGADGRMIRYSESCRFGDLNAAPDTAVWGDSYGAELTVAVGEVLESAHRSVIQITASACPPTIDYPPRRPDCSEHNRSIVQQLTRDQRIHTVILVAKYSYHDGPDWPLFASGFKRSLEALRAAGKRVGILFPLPVFDFDPPTVIARLAHQGRNLESYGVPFDEFERKSRKAEQLLRTVSDGQGVFAIRPADLLCDRAFCRAYEPSAGVLYFNKDHLSVKGARLVLAPYASQL